MTAAKHSQDGKGADATQYFSQGFVSSLRNDKRFIVSAAGKAEKAVALILGETREGGEEGR